MTPDADALYQLVCWSFFVLGPVAFALLMSGISAPYGRYQRTGWGFPINARVAWLTQELPSLLGPICVIAATASLGSFTSNLGAPRTVFTALFMLHYAYRALVFPFLIRGGKSTPFVVWLMALLFCVANGFLQGWLVVREVPESQRWQLHHYAGLGLWVFGWLTNVHADAVLRSLRTGKGQGYKVPYGGMYTYVSAANYCGEIIEWTGYAVGLWALPAAAFAFFTFCNLAPRGHQHHQWYQKTFPNYPRNRKAVLPFIW